MSVLFIMLFRLVITFLQPLRKANNPRVGGPVDKIMCLLFNMLSRLVITLLPRSMRLLISWLQSPSAVILEPLQNKVREGNDNPLQYSCLENPIDGEAWWAAVHGVAKIST